MINTRMYCHNALLSFARLVGSVLAAVAVAVALLTLALESWVLPGLEGVPDDGGGVVLLLYFFLETGLSSFFVSLIPFIL